MKRLTIISCLLLAMEQAGAQTQPITLHEDNIDETVRAMTLEEKARIIVGRNDDLFGGYEGQEPAPRTIEARISGFTQAIPRLGIPATCLVDGPAGVVIVTREGNSKHYTATGFPVGTLLACSWDTQLAERVGRAMGSEVREYGLDVILGPGMNIHRSPLCGRNFEYFSEDPLLSGRMAAAVTRGIQQEGVGACLKHFAVNSQETNRTDVDEVVGQRALREIYLKGFEIAVKEGRPWSIMSSYNRLNGPLTQENRELLTTVLRDEWHYDGIVMTDWIQKRNTAAQIHAGNDLLQPGYQVQMDELMAQVERGELSMDDVDRAVGRMLRYIVKTPSFRHYKYSNDPDLKAGALTAREAATQGMVLLKNANHTLPLTEGQRKVALFGCTTYDLMAGGTGSGSVVVPYVTGLPDGLRQAGYEPAEELATLYADYKKFERGRERLHRGPHAGWYQQKPLKELELSRELVDHQAEAADVAVVVLGRQAGEGSDREEGDFYLSDTEQTLLQRVCETFHARGKRVVVVLNVGGVVETASWKSRPDAILVAWQPGEEAGNAIADVLSGRVCPSGKLSMTWPVSVMDHPSSAHFPLHGYQGPRWGPRDNVDYTLHSEGINIGYRYFCTAEKEVSYAFGYGLSYTTFAYDRPQVTATKDGFRATVRVTNTGSVAGREAVQLYVEAPASSLQKPLRELKAFAKTRELKPGESEVLTFIVDSYALASFDEQDSRWLTEAGTYTIDFGAAADDIRARTVYRQRQQQSWPVNDVLRPNREL